MRAPMMQSVINSVEARLKQLETNPHLMQFDWRLDKIDKRTDWLEAEIRISNKRLRNLKKLFISDSRSKNRDGLSKKLSNGTDSGNGSSGFGLSSQIGSQVVGLSETESSEFILEMDSDTSAWQFDRPSTCGSYESSLSSDEIRSVQEVCVGYKTIEEDTLTICSDEVLNFVPEVIIETSSTLRTPVAPNIRIQTKQLRPSCEACCKNRKPVDAPNTGVNVPLNPAGREQQDQTEIAVNAPEKRIVKKANRRKKTFLCPICFRKFNSACNRSTHMKIHKDERPFECSTCDKKFRRKDALQNHLRTHTKETPFQCGICQKNFTRKGILVNHMKMHSTVKQHQCHFRRCNFAGVNNSNLKAHMRIVHGIYQRLLRRTSEDDLVCFRCGLAADSYMGLAKHFVRHHKRYLASCMREVHANFVEQQLKTRSDVVVEEMTDVNGDSHYTCNICAAQRTSWSEFVAHVRLHSEAFGEPVDTDRDQPRRVLFDESKLLRCQWCEKYFILKEALFQHVLRVHAWDKTFKCRSCDKSFYKVSSYRAHRKSHHPDDNGTDSDYTASESSVSECESEL